MVYLREEAVPRPGQVLSESDGTKGKHGESPGMKGLILTAQPLSSPRTGPSLPTAAARLSHGSQAFFPALF